MKRFLSVLTLATLVASCTAPAVTPPANTDVSSAASSAVSSETVSESGSAFVPSSAPPSFDINDPNMTLDTAMAAKTYTGTGPFSAGPVSINPAIAKGFSTDEAKNLAVMEKTYGFTLSAADKKFFAANSFLLKPVPETSITPQGGEIDREMLGLFQTVAGESDYKTRTQANTVFLTSDLFLTHFRILYEELLKEMENKVFAPTMKTIAVGFTAAAGDHAKKAATPEEKLKWQKVEAYFAVAASLLSASQSAPSMNDLMKSGSDPGAAMDAFRAQDKNVDTLENSTMYVKTLHLDSQVESWVLADLKKIYDSSGKDVPATFYDEYTKYGKDTGVDFAIDFAQFTPRSHYTNTSERRQYFRAVKWFSDTAFFLKSKPLTDDAFAIAQLMSEHPAALFNYNRMESTINFLVGTSDDLMPSDYMDSLAAAKGKTDEAAAAADYLAKLPDPKIKSLSASYATVGAQKTDDVIALTKGMRFFSGKFIIDSSWTQLLTQGDEAVRPGYPEKLPHMASELEVMGLLGSKYALSSLPMMYAYNKAVDKGMSDMQKMNDALGASYWQTNIYTGWLWAIQGLFSFLQDNKKSLPAFMQSPLYDAKTLMTGAASWTELRHATLLYAKQSSAELGGGPPACDDRKIPAPPKGYIEPDLPMFQRLLWLANSMQKGIADLGFTLDNAPKLDAYAQALQTTITYTEKELGNGALAEKISSHKETDDYGKTCTVYTIDDGSDFEILRTGIIQKLVEALPNPADGPVLLPKDKRAALVADVHNGRDSAHPNGEVLYEGVGVPLMMLTAVKDANGPRIAIGFTQSQYEQVLPAAGKRMTDEDWQQQFYEPAPDAYDDPFKYTDPKTWPAWNTWYQPLFDRK